jgi:diacylglycerol kinase family enzyme
MYQTCSTSTQQRKTENPVRITLESEDIEKEEEKKKLLIEENKNNEESKLNDDEKLF